MRNIFLFILFLIAVFFVRRNLQRGDEGRNERAATDGEGGPKQQRDAPSDYEQMLGCAHCGLHVPESEGVRGEGLFYCSEAHRRLGPRA